MARLLSYKALINMDKQKVVVKDIENDIYDQICEVQVNSYYETVGKKGKERLEKRILGIDLVNEEHVFEYNWKGECENGKFEVYSYG